LISAAVAAVVEPRDTGAGPDTLLVESGWDLRIGAEADKPVGPESWGRNGK